MTNIPDPTFNIPNQVFNAIYAQLEQGHRYQISGTEQHFAYIKRGLSRAKYRICKRRKIDSNALRLCYVQGLGIRQEEGTLQPYVMTVWLEVNEAAEPIPAYAQDTITNALTQLGVTVKVTASTAAVLPHPQQLPMQFADVDLSDLMEEDK